MTQVLSWWLIALILGVSAPLWVRALVERWDRKARERTERLLASANKQAPPDKAGEG